MPERSGLEDRIDEALAAYADGGPGALKRWLVEHPSCAGVVRTHVARLEALGLLDTDGEPTPLHPERIGGFRLVERIGEGGMGLVWIAEEEALGRRVALKMIRPEQLWFSGARERFRREVEAVARLQHPGIVPVYAAGEEGGVPFFTMELVDGRTLGDVLRAVRGRDPARLTGADLARVLDDAAPRGGAGEAVAGDRGARGALFEGSWTDACLRIAQQVAEALDHAHGRGLVHRDVKPSNVALTRFGRALLLDFGLVHSEVADRVTRSASQPGSLPYMSPEQVAGASQVDARSDVYSLGATLYELLTLTPAFEGVSVSEVARRIEQGDVQRPRARVPSLPRDVEVVCMKALDLDPRQRYAGAADLARDLGNLLARRPIEARRAGPWMHVVRWGQRHPRASAAVAVALPLALVALTAVAWIERARSTQVRDINRDLAESLAATRREQEHAQASFEDALAAVDRLLTRLADERLEHLPHLDGLRRELYLDALDFYERFAERRADDPELRVETVRARIRMGPLLVFLGRNAESGELIAESIAILEGCLAEAPDDERLRHELARSLAAAAPVYANLGRTGDRENSARRSLELYRELLEESPDRLAYRMGVATALQSLGRVASRTGRPDEAEELFREALDVGAGDVETTVEAAELAVSVSVGLGVLLVENERSDEGEGVLLEALEIARRWAEREPERPELADVEASLLHPLAQAAMERGDTERALALWTRQQEVAERLVRDHPGSHAYEEDLLRAIANRGYALIYMKRYPEAEAAVRRATVLAEEHAAALPDVPAHHFQLAQLRLNLAETLMRQGEPVRALELLDDAMPAAEAYEAANPSLLGAVSMSASLRAIRAENLIAIDEHAEAAACLRDLRRRDAPVMLRFNAVILFARCARIAHADASLEPDERDALADEYELEALDALRWAVAAGFRDFERLDGVEDLASLRALPAYEQVLAPLRGAR